MARLSTQDTVAFRSIKVLCYQGLDSASLRERVGERLSRHLRVASYCFGASDPATGLPVHSISVGLAPEAINAFMRLVLSTPTLEFGRWATRAQPVARVEELVDGVERDPYMTEVLTPSGLRYDVQVACVGNGRTWGHLCLRRTHQAGPFEAHAVRFLGALVPHLTAGLRAAATRAALTTAPGSTTGVVVIGPDGSIELANGVAQRLFTRPTVGQRHSFLTAVNIVAARLERSLTDGGLELVPTLTVTDETAGEIYRLRSERVVGQDGRPRGLVLIEPAAPLGPTTTPELLTLLGLTPREADVALAVLRGQSTMEIAADLAISPYTVHDHLRRIFDKVGVNSRQQLAVRLLSGSQKPS